MGDDILAFRSNIVIKECWYSDTSYQILNACKSLSVIKKKKKT